MLELYQAYGDYHDMMGLTEELVAHLATELRGTTDAHLSAAGELDLTPPWRRATMTDLIEEHAGVDVDLDTPIDELRRICDEHDVPSRTAWGPGKLILELYEKTTEAELWGPVFVCDYPKEVSPLARDHREMPGYVERFEPIVAGRELGNAFSELTDPVEQRATFEDQARAEGGRRRRGDGRRRGLPPRARVRPAADRRPRHRHRPAGDAARRRADDPRRHPVPDAATRAGRRRHERHDRYWAAASEPRAR